MWSKQADMRNNTNMTSFKNKITNRKQQKKSTINAHPQQQQQPNSDNSTNDSDKSSKKQQKSSSKQRNRNKKNSEKKSKTTTTCDNVSVINSTNVLDKDLNKNDDIISQSTTTVGLDDGEADVVLRTTTSDENFKNINNPKRYSDTFVIKNGNDLSPEQFDKTARKSRRFTDLFRSGTLIKSTSSMENLNLLKTNDLNNHNNKDLINKRNLSTKDLKNTKNIEKTTNTQPAKLNENSSYLKRVRSKIYKTKSVDTLSTQPKSQTTTKTKNPIYDRIPEDSVINATSRHSIDFRLIRQSSNLEQIRNNNNSNSEISNNNVMQKPVLMKAKSSSAINLNLLRTRRSRIIEQWKEKCCKDVYDEFDFIAFGGGFRDKFGGSQRITKMVDDVIHEQQQTQIDLGENKPSQPVSRSGSDRRPDVVREEISKNIEGSSNSDHFVDKPDNDNAATPEGTINLLSTATKKKHNSNINRSESVKEQSEKRKQRRNISDPSSNTTSGDVELDQPGLSNTDSGSSSNSSISYNGRLSESPSNSADLVVDGTATKQSTSDWESDTELVDWKKLVSEEEVRKLQPYEKKRQDVVNELFHTENTHVQNLRVLYEIFYKTLYESQTLKPDELSLIFPNIREILHVHKQLNKEMKRKRHEDPLVRNLGDTLLNIFSGSIGENLQKSAAIFCERQQLALKFIQEKRRRDPKFEAILIECEKKPQCKRLPFQGIIPTEMQRLSKYPLLIERLIGNLESNNDDVHVQEEITKLKKAHNASKEILNYVNEAAKLAMDKARLEEIQSHLDTKDFDKSEHPIAQEFRTIDLTKYKLIKEGNMQLRRPNKGIVPVTVLLLEEAVIILHKEGDKYLLKFFQSGNPAQPQPLSPIIKISTMLARNNAVLKNALFLINTTTTNSQMYDLSAEDEIQRDLWFKHFSDAANAYNKREGKTKRPEPPPDSDESETVQDLPSARDVTERAETVSGNDENNQQTEVDDEEDDDQIFSDAHDDRISEYKDDVANSSEGEGLQRRVTADDWPLIQPSQVHVEVPPVHTAESRLTPLEQIRRKDEEVRKALEDKEGLVADLLSIPREHFHVIADMAGENQEIPASCRDPVEMVMAAVYQVDQLHLAVNEALNISETTTIAATGGKYPACQSQEITANNTPPPSIPAQRIRDIANPLSPLLTNLLSYVKHVEEERDRLRKELHKMRERLHEQQALHGPVDEVDTSSSSPPETQDLESIKENPTETES